jgi:hypothetical protein
MQRVLLGIALLVVVVAVAACGGPSKPTTGIYGIAVINHGGRMDGSETPSPLPRGFGMSTLEHDWKAPIWVRPVVDGHPGKVVARTVTDTSGIFRIPVPPGRYLVRGEADGPWYSKVVTVREGAFTHLVIQTRYRF